MWVVDYKTPRASPGRGGRGKGAPPGGPLSPFLSGSDSLGVLRSSDNKGQMAVWNSTFLTSQGKSVCSCKRVKSRSGQHGPRVRKEAGTRRPEPPGKLTPAQGTRKSQHPSPAWPDRLLTAQPCHRAFQPHSTKTESRLYLNMQSKTGADVGSLRITWKVKWRNLKCYMTGN